jgi:Icc-related predicted phosphoesterase
MKIWFLSDTHGWHEKLCIPTDVDAVIHCGDESETKIAALNEAEARDFFDWYSALSIPTKIFVPGNHSTAIEAGLIRRGDYPHVQFLIHEFWEWDGIKIFGSPYTPNFFDWAYMKPRTELEPIWNSIPSGIDILITHGPPKGVGDLTCDMDTRESVHVGSMSLMKQVVQRIKPKIHAFGHIHDEPKFRNFGIVEVGSTKFVNCSCCDIANRLKNHGLILEFIR